MSFKEKREAYLLQEAKNKIIEEQRIFKIRENAWKDFFEPGFQILNDLKIPQLLKDFKEENWNNVGTLYQYPTKPEEVKLKAIKYDKFTDKPILVAKFCLAREKSYSYTYENNCGERDIFIETAHVEGNDEITISVEQKEKDIFLILNSEAIILKNKEYNKEYASINEKYIITKLKNQEISQESISNTLKNLFPNRTYTNKFPNKNNEKEKYDLSKFPKIIDEFLVKVMLDHEKIIDPKDTKIEPRYWNPKDYFERLEYL